MQALDHIVIKAVAVRHDFADAEDGGSFKGQPAGHDEADVAAAEDEDALADQGSHLV